jgi:hypothetical protein
LVAEKLPSFKLGGLVGELLTAMEAKHKEYSSQFLQGQGVAGALVVKLLRWCKPKFWMTINIRECNDQVLDAKVLKCCLDINVDLENRSLGKSQLPATT